MRSRPLFSQDIGAGMGFSIRYRSTESMHPVRAFEIKEHAESLNAGYAWFSCEPVTLQQRTDGVLYGASKPEYYPAELGSADQHIDGVPDGTVLSLAEVLCELSRSHHVDWRIGHDLQVEAIGWIEDGVANEELIEELETIGAVGDLLDDPASVEISDEPPPPSPSSSNDEDQTPRVLKFPNQ